MSAVEPLASASLGAVLPDVLTWSGRPQKADLAPLPTGPAVYLLVSASGAPVQLATTQQLRRLAMARLADPDRPKHGKVDLAEIVRGARWRKVHSAFEARWWYYRLAREMYPRQYLRLISFGPAWFLHVNWEQQPPEIRVTERIWQAAGAYLGPWLTHDTCQTAWAGLCDLFDLCRYPEQVRRAPGGQRCSYAEMGRCDAPCDGSAPLDRYAERCRAAWHFAGGAVRPWIDEARQRMKQAAGAQRFEAAAQLKRQLAFAWKWHDRWLALVRPAEGLNYLLAVPVTRRRAWKLFLFRQGQLDDGPILTDRQLPTSGAAWLRERVATPWEAVDSEVRMEQTWFVAHFLRSKEGDASLVRPLDTPVCSAAFPDELRAWVTQRRAARAPMPPPLAPESASGADDRPDADTEKPE